MNCFDICCCTYNSEKWLSAFFAAMLKTDYDKKCLRLYFADNHSCDGTVNRLKEYQNDIGGVFGAFEVLPLDDNLGFGTASNICAKKGESELILFLNIDTEILPDAFVRLNEAISAAPSKTAVFEMRQLPYEHPKFYNPATLLTSWASGAAMVITREAFRATGGFDESIFMYCEDVDLSWRVRLAGFNIMYVPSAAVLHHTGDVTVPKPSQLAGEIAGGKILRLKYGTKSDIREWDSLYRLFLPKFEADEKAFTSFKALNASAEKHKKQYRAFYKKNVKKSGFKPVFDFGYEFVRRGAEYVSRNSEKECDIAVIILSKGGKNLSATLSSLARQTDSRFKTAAALYGGADAAEIKNAFARLSLPLANECIFETDSESKWEAANTALERINAEYICFLNEGDCLFADFIEAVNNAAQQNPGCKMLCTGAVQAVADTAATNDGTALFPVGNTVSAGISSADYYYNNPTPLSCVIFARSLFSGLGGFDLSLGDFADWELWLRYSSQCDITVIDKALSVFTVPSGDDFFTALACTPNRRGAMQEKLAQYSCRFTALQISSIVKNGRTEAVAGDYSEMLKTADEISRSSVWRGAALARAFARLLRRAADGIERHYGPDLPDMKTPPDISDFSFQSQNAALYSVQPCINDTAEYRNIQHFIIKTQNSGYMKNAKRLFGFFKR